MHLIVVALAHMRCVIPRPQVLHQRLAPLPGPVFEPNSIELCSRKVGGWVGAASWWRFGAWVGG